MICTMILTELLNGKKTVQQHFCVFNILPEQLHVHEFSLKRFRESTVDAQVSFSETSAGTQTPFVHKDLVIILPSSVIN